MVGDDFYKYGNIQKKLIMYDFISRAFFKDLRERTRLKVRSFASSTFGNILELGSSNINHKISAVFKSF